MDSEKYRKEVREMLDHENVLVNSRYTWLLTTQSLLLAATGVFWGKQTSIELLVSLIGFVSCVSVGYSLHLANTRDFVAALRARDNSNPTPRLLQQALSCSLNSTAHRFGPLRERFLHPSFS